ncbi:pentatricopeptide repeat-containing protein At5g56310-like [Prosopis cineraria]|uniref:pentatricopeptide repeat-containing protein At5g56310-like n=1 Tax=Prosopis cineraria TaxID=364024 RepID=UPI0024108F83|nr:pentatricopeptide repeat-containing protein At5g56310-like [Prosopis cineraria]XP_054804421.1 pentatricopeptide repeat-containing protein At5g56310-like [Prosopis cineraria]
MMMRQVSEVSAFTNRIVALLNTCTSQTQLHQIQAQLVIHNLHSDSTIASHFITACQSQGLLSSAFLLLTFLPRPNVFICNSLIRAFAHSHIPRIPLAIYFHMHRNSVHPNNYTFPFLFKSLSDFREFKQVQCIYTHVLKLGHLNDIYVQNSLLDVYASCGRMDLCRQLFDEMLQRDVVSWTVLIMGHRNAGKYDDALIVFEQMQYAGVLPNRVTMVNALAACAKFGAIEMGIWIHNNLKKNGWELDVVLGTALIEMYAKCGRVEEGMDVFRMMKEKNVFTWNALIKGLASAKGGAEAIWWFHRMEEEGVRADEVTLVAVLSACSHSGLVDMGQQIFSYLVDGKYGFSPNVKHYACMIDLLARSGRVKEAFEFARHIPFEPTKAIWGSLFASSKSQGQLELSEFAARKLVDLEPHNSAYYIHLSNLYAEMGRWWDVESVRGMMKDRQLTKDLGSSSVQIEPKQDANV